MKFALFLLLGLAAGVAGLAHANTTAPTSGQGDLSPLLVPIRDAPDPSTAVSAYAKALSGGADSLSAERTYLTRMVDFGLPEMADAQAQDLILRDPNNGLAWAVAAHMSARRGNMAAALGQIETAANQSPSDPFVLRTAGNVFAWYDSRGAAVDIPDVIKAPVPDMKKRLNGQPTFATAYGKALDDYKQAPPTQPTQQVTQPPDTAPPTEPYTLPPSYPVSTYAYDVPAYYPPAANYYYSSAPYWYPSYSSWCGSPWWGVGFGASFVFSNNNCNWNGNWNHNHNGNWNNSGNWSHNGHGNWNSQQHGSPANGSGFGRSARSNAPAVVGASSSQGGSGFSTFGRSSMPDVMAASRSGSMGPIAPPRASSPQAAPSVRSAPSGRSGGGGGMSASRGGSGRSGGGGGGRR